MAIDIPQIWKYLGELIGLMIEDGLWPLANLKTCCSPLQPIKKAGVLVAHVLHDASQRLVSSCHNSSAHFLWKLIFNLARCVLFSSTGLFNALMLSLCLFRDISKLVNCGDRIGCSGLTCSHQMKISRNFLERM